MQFERVEDADKALGAMQGYQFNGKEIKVTKLLSQEERKQETTKFKNLFIRNLPKAFTEQELETHFGQFGLIQSKKVDPKTDYALGYITYEDPESAQKAIEKMNMTYIGGNYVYVQQHLSKKELEHQLKQPNSIIKMQQIEQNKNTVVVKNFSQVPAEEIISSLNQIGKVLSHQVKMRRNGQGSVIYATMEDQNQVQRAIYKLNSHVLIVEQWVHPEQLRQEKIRSVNERTERTIKELFNKLGNQDEQQQVQRGQYNMNYRQNQGMPAPMPAPMAQ